MSKVKYRKVQGRSHNQKTINNLLLDVYRWQSPSTSLYLLTFVQ